jgi:polyhydroxyalkanoate synthesis regulator phasin
MSDGKREGEGRAEDEPKRGRSRLESMIPDMVRKAISQGAEALGDEKLRETLVGEVWRKAVSKGGEVLENSEDSIRRMVSDLPLPKEVVDRLTARVDDYKAELFRVVKDEVHEFLDRVDLGAELQKMLTSLSFEITTEVRFVPNDKSTGSGVKPDVKSKARVKRNKAEPRKGRPAAETSEPDDET